MANEVQEISVARKFSKFPAGRFLKDGPFSGEAFRDNFLVPALKAGKKVRIDLDGTAGFGSSFLEEAFGGLVRAGWRPAEILERLELRSSDSSVIDEIQHYINDAGAANGM